MNMLAYDKTIMETHESKILKSAGHDFEVRQSLVKFRKN